jgi:hypothetical protein
LTGLVSKSGGKLGNPHGFAVQLSNAQGSWRKTDGKLHWLNTYG